MEKHRSSHGIHITSIRVGTSVYSGTGGGFIEQRDQLVVLVAKDEEAAEKLFGFLPFPAFFAPFG